MTRRQFLIDASNRAGIDPDKRIEEFMRNGVKAGFSPEEFNEWLDGPMTIVDVVMFRLVCNTTQEQSDQIVADISRRQWAKRGGN